MLSIGQVSPQGFLYYSDASQTSENYYSKGLDSNAQTPSLWHGKGAESLELAGEVNADSFNKILQGILPNGQKLGRLNKEGEREHRPGFDLTFSAPKSVSILYSVLEHKEIETAHLEAVKSALTYIEKEALHTRVYDKQTKQQVSQPSHAMIAGIFQHNLSRENEPALHSHAVLMNATLSNDRKWRSLEPKEIFKQKMLIGAIYRAELAQNLLAMGYAIERKGRDGLFEVKGIPQDALNAFSTRRQQVLEFKRSNPNATPARLADVAKLTRSPKEEHNLAGLQKNWKKTLSQYDVDLTPRASLAPSNPNISQIVDRALSALEERSSVFNLRSLKERVTQALIGVTDFKTGLKEIDDRIQSQSIIVGSHKGQSSLVTTPRALQLEKDTISAVLDHQGEGLPHPSFLNTPSKCVDAGLNDEQAKVVDTAMSLGHRFLAVQGFAGTGKSTTLATLSKLVDNGTYSLTALAPTSTATNDLKESGLNAQTLSSFLQEYDPNTKHSITKSLHHSYIVLDESSMVSTQDMKMLLDICNQKNAARVILVGDTKQLDAVQAGNPFEQLQKHGLVTVELKNIQRQNSLEDRSNIKQFIQGNHKQVLERMAPQIHEAELGTMNETTANSWLALAPDIRPNTAIIASTHNEIAGITATLRDGLKREGAIHSTIKLETLRSISLEASERGQIDNYNSDQVLLIRRKDECLGLKANSHYLIKDVTADALILKRDSKETKLPINHSALKLSELYSKDVREFGVGDKVRWTRNDIERRFVNSEQAKITHISKHGIHFKSENGEIFSIDHNDKNGRHISHAWATTIHAAQGRSINRVIAQLDAYNPTLTNQKSFYTTISRFRESLAIITNDKGQLIDTVEANSGQKIAAQELHIDNTDKGKSLSQMKPSRPKNHKELAPPQRSRDYENDFER